MLTLAPGETLLLVIRRHWVVLAGPLAIAILLLALPPLGAVLARLVFPALGEPLLHPLITLALALYLMGLFAYALLVWLDYYLDVWIITTQRIIDIEQRGLFRREISEISLERVQNVTVEIPGFLATVLEFGNLKIQTAGAGEFTIADVTDLDRAKDLILQYSRQRHPDERPATNAGRTNVLRSG